MFIYAEFWKNDALNINKHTLSVLAAQIIRAASERTVTEKILLI